MLASVNLLDVYKLALYAENWFYKVVAIAVCLKSYPKHINIKTFENTATSAHMLDSFP